MKNFPIRAALLLVCLVTAGCHPSAPSLVGIYSAENKGKRVEFLRVEQTDGKFLASESKPGGGWKKAEEVKPLAKADLERLSGAPVTGDVSGLGTNEAALFQVSKGWKARGFESKTGYVFVSLFGPIELHKDGE